MRALPNGQKPPCPVSNPSCVRLVAMMVFSAMTTVIPVQRCVAQLLFGDPHFAIQPHAAATGTTNPGAGEYPLDSTPNAIVSVPPACAGAKRCPLLVQLPGGGQPASVMTSWMRPVANRYGFILLTLSEASYQADYVHDVMTAVLHRFAIDPDKIAIAGRCGSGGTGMTYGLRNLQLFSRIIIVSGDVPVNGLDPRDTTAEFLIDDGLHETPYSFDAAKTLRTAGHRTTVLIGLREHEHQWEDYDFVGRWLMDSWTSHTLATHSAKITTPAPVLTVAALTKLTTFWTRFANEPDSIRLTARRRYLHEVIVPVGQEQPSAWITDMPAFAAHVPAVADDLRVAGLTAEQHDAYRIALFSAIVADAGGVEVGTITSPSTLAKNLVFLRTHPEEMKALARAGIGDPSKSARLDDCCTDPAQVDQMGPLGIWRTP